MLALALTPALTMAADPPRIVGTWEGVLDPGAQPKKRIVVHIAAEQDGSLSGTIDYPDQDVSGILITAITYKAHVLHFESTPNLSSYDGTPERRWHRDRGQLEARRNPVESDPQTHLLDPSARLILQPNTLAGRSTSLN